MKSINGFIAASLLVFCGIASARTIEVEVNGLVCAFCAQGIEKTLRRFPATDDVFVSLEHRIVAISLKDHQSIDEQALRNAVTDAGYATVGIRYSETPLAELEARVHNHQRHADD